MAALQVLLVSICVASVFAQFTDVEVKTDVGTFVGFSEEVNLGDKNVTISKFLGIPYGEPPVGDLRFRKSVMKYPLKEPLKVQAFGNPCLQMYAVFPLPPTTDSEDCLYLNIFKPETNDDTGEKLPVMIWMYGGAFVAGKADNYIGDALAANGPVIVVTFNYRISLWGFLSTEDSNAPGNAGLWDQHLAIQWVNKNINSFGGDASRVTIFGQSAGAGSVIFQGLYPENKGLFHRIIAQSGSAAAVWAVRPDPKKDAEKLATLVDCTTDNTKDMMECLRRAPVEKLNATLNDLANWEMSLPMPFVPSVDDDFVPRFPDVSLDVDQTENSDLRKLFSSFDLMIGINSGEGGGSVSPMTGADTDAENFLPNSTFFAETLVPFMINIMVAKDAPDVLRDIIVAEYTDWDDPENPDNIRQQFCDLYGDSSLASTQRTLHAHASLSDSRTYLYYMNILLSKSVMPRPSWFQRALHGDDLMLTFGNKIDMEIPGMIENRDFLDWEKRAADNVMTLWTNFAKTGNPNQPRDIGIDWLPYTPTRRRYIELANDVTASVVKERLLERRMKLWGSIIPALLKVAKCESAADQPRGTCSREGDCPP